MKTEAKQIAEFLPELTKISSGILRKESQGGIQKTDKGYEVSVYLGDVVTPDRVLVEMSRLKAAFPKQSVEFFNLLSERVIKNGFSKERLQDAVNTTIDNFSYKELNISDIIKYDKKIKLYTYNEVSQMVTKGIAEFSDFEIRDINGVIFRVKKSDL